MTSNGPETGGVRGRPRGLRQALRRLRERVLPTPDPVTILLVLFRSRRPLTASEIAKELAGERVRIRPRRVRAVLEQLGDDPSLRGAVSHHGCRYGLTGEGRDLLQLPAWELATRLGREPPQTL